MKPRIKLRITVSTFLPNPQHEARKSKRLLTNSTAALMGKGWRSARRGASNQGVRRKTDPHNLRQLIYRDAGWTRFSALTIPTSAAKEPAGTAIQHQPQNHRAHLTICKPGAMLLWLTWTQQLTEVSCRGSCQPLRLHPTARFKIPALHHPHPAAKKGSPETPEHLNWPGLLPELPRPRSPPTTTTFFTLTP